MIRLGVIGTGGISHMHMRDIRERNAPFDIVAASDTDGTRLAEFAGKYGVCEPYSDYRELLKNAGVDAVLICLPHHLHEEACVAAFAAGKHVLIEKPIARDCAEAEKIIEASQKAGKVLMIGFNERYFPAHAMVKKLLDEDAIGDIVSARTDHFQNFSPPLQSWWRKREMVGGGCVIGSGIHRLDLLRWYLGEADEVFAFEVGMPERLEAEVACAASIRFRSGAIAEFFCNWGVHQYHYGETLGLYGRYGLMFCDNGSLALVTADREKLRAGIRDSGTRTQVDLPAVPSQMEHFADCILHGRQPLTSGYEGYKSLELVMAIDRSAQLREPVSLPRE